MPDNDQSFEILEAEWEREIENLAARSAKTDIDVLIRWQFGYLRANTFQPLVSDRRLHLYLQRQPDSSFGNGYIQISLPTQYQGQYEKHTSDSGDVLLKMRTEFVRPSDVGVVAWTEVYLSTSPDMLPLVDGGTLKPN